MGYFRINHLNQKKKNFIKLFQCKVQIKTELIMHHKNHTTISITFLAVIADVTNCAEQIIVTKSASCLILTAEAT